MEQREYLLPDVAARLTDNPLLRQQMGHLSGPAAKNTLPVHALGDRIYWCMAVALGQWPFRPSRDAAEARGMASAYVIKAMQSQVFLWSVSALMLAREMPELPRHTITEKVLPYPQVFFSYETAFISTLPDRPSFYPQAERIETNAALLFIEKDSEVMEESLVLVNDITGSGGQEGIMGYVTIPLGSIYPDDFPGDQRPAFGTVLKYLAFINSTVADTSCHRLPRAERRRLQKAGASPEEVDEEISVVTLRAIEKKRADETEEEHQRRMCHWWVRGHWRNQWFSSEETHRVIWIEPHLKGDLEQPLKQKVYHVKR